MDLAVRKRFRFSLVMVIMLKYEAERFYRDARITEKKIKIGMKMKASPQSFRMEK
jgi:hypothetical protein